MSKTKQYKVVSLFSGAMGLDLGMQATNRYKLLACVEKIPVFCDTIRTNRDAGHIDKGVLVYEGDICGIDPHVIMKDLGLKPGDLDVLVGGPPCQTFSTAGSRKGITDPRGTLIWQYLRFLEAFRPKCFIMENVRGLISSSIKPKEKRSSKKVLSQEEMPGSVVDLFLSDLKKINNGEYRVDAYEVNSVNYGAPQIRERILFIGNRSNAIIDFPDPTHGIPETAVPDLFSQNEMGVEPWKTLRDAIGDLKENKQVIMDFSPRKKNI